MDPVQRLIGPKSRRLAFSIVAIFLCLTGVNAAYSNDPLTGLPVYPGVNDPSPLPDSDFCGKHMQGDFYIVMGEKFVAVATWYGRRLTGYHQYHSMMDGRSQVTFFSPNGSNEVTVTATRASSAVYSISYSHFQPGLQAQEMLSFSKSRTACD
jgi:hypothetical protein